MLHVALGMAAGMALAKELVNVAGGPSLRYHWDDLIQESADLMFNDLVSLHL